MSRDTSLPSSLFDACDPGVEKLLGGSAGAFLLRHLSVRPEEGETGAHADAAANTGPDEVRPRRDRCVGPEEIEAFVAERVRALEGPAPAPPPLEQGAAEERIWVLADLASTAAGTARQRATFALREAMADLEHPDRVDDRTLANVLADFEGSDRAHEPDSPMLLRILELALEQAAGRRIRES